MSDVSGKPQWPLQAIHEDSSKAKAVLECIRELPPTELTKAVGRRAVLPTVSVKQTATHPKAVCFAVHRILSNERWLPGQSDCRQLGPPVTRRLCVPSVAGDQCDGGQGGRDTDSGPAATPQRRAEMADQPAP